MKITTKLPSESQGTSSLTSTADNFVRLSVCRHLDALYWRLGGSSDIDDDGGRLWRKTRQWYYTEGRRVRARTLSGFMIYDDGDKTRLPIPHPPPHLLCLGDKVRIFVKETVTLIGSVLGVRWKQHISGRPDRGKDERNLIGFQK